MTKCEQFVRSVTDDAAREVDAALAECLRQGELFLEGHPDAADRARKAEAPCGCAFRMAKCCVRLAIAVRGPEIVGCRLKMPSGPGGLYVRAALDYGRLALFEWSYVPETCEALARRLYVEGLNDLAKARRRRKK